MTNLYMTNNSCLYMQHKLPFDKPTPERANMGFEWYTVRCAHQKNTYISETRSAIDDHYFIDHVVLNGSEPQVTYLNSGDGSSDLYWEEALAMLKAPSNEPTLIGDVEDFLTLSKARLIPRPYQEEGIELLRLNKRYGLFFAAGLGKTLTAAEAAECPTLITCPSYLVPQWYEFLQTQYPGQTIIAPPIKKDKHGDYTPTSSTERVAALETIADWYVINHEMLRLSPEASKQVSRYNSVANLIRKDGLKFTLPYFKTLIIDESHHFKNEDSVRSKIAYYLSRLPTTNRVYLLSGSAIKREPDDLQMQLKIMRPHDERFQHYFTFVSRYCNAIWTTHGTQITGAKPALKPILDEVAMVRSYEDVGMHLPKLIPIAVPVVMEPELRKAYRLIQSQFSLGTLSWDSAMAIIHMLRMITSASKAKIAACVDTVHEVANTTGSILVFTWYKDAAQMIAQKIGAICITGDVPQSKRAQLARTNNRIVATISSLSEGVDLSHIDDCIFYEEDYTPGAMYQALSRIRRAGAVERTTPVRCYYILAEQTIDMVIHNTQERRGVTAMAVARMALK